MTSAPAIQRVVYQSWRDGFNSRLRVIGKNTEEFNCLNMQVYDDGSLGVRPWWKLMPTTNLTTSDTIDDSAFLAWRRGSSVQGELYMHAYSADIFFFDLNAKDWSAFTNMDVAVTVSDNRAAYWGGRHGWGNGGLYVGSAQHSSLPNDNFIFGGEGHNAEGTATVTTITWTDATDPITNFVLYRDRIWGWHNVDPTTDAANRLYYTNAASYVLADAGNFIDIGAASDDYYILGVWALRDSLLIAMSDDGWWVFTGTPDSGSLRYIGDYVTPAHGAAGAVLNNAVYFIAPEGRQVCIATPSGVDTQSLLHIRPWLEDSKRSVFNDYRGLASQTEQSLFLPSTDDAGTGIDALEFVNGAWCGTAVGRTTFSGTTTTPGILRDLATINRGKTYAFMMEDPLDPGSHELQLYTRDITLNRPSRTGDEFSDITEVAASATSTVVSLGAVRLAPFAPPGKQGAVEEARVRQVVVDFHYWKDTDNDFYADPDMRCHVYDAGWFIKETIDTFTTASLPTFEDSGFPGSQDHGLPYRWIFRFPLEDADFRSSVSVVLDQIQSISIDRIIVDYEVRPDNHWAGQMGGT